MFIPNTLFQRGHCCPSLLHEEHCCLSKWAFLPQTRSRFFSSLLVKWSHFRIRFKFVTGIHYELQKSLNTSGGLSWISSLSVPGQISAKSCSWYCPQQGDVLYIGCHRFESRHCVDLHWTGKLIKKTVHSTNVIKHNITYVKRKYSTTIQIFYNFLLIKLLSKRLGFKRLTYLVFIYPIVNYYSYPILVKSLFDSLQPTETWNSGEGSLHSAVLISMKIAFMS